MQTKISSNNSIKWWLIIYSLFPLLLVTTIKNLSFVTNNETGTAMTKCQFIANNLPTLIGLLICLLWLLASVTVAIMFRKFQGYDNNEGFTIVKIESKSNDSLDFFLTIIIAFLIDNFDTWQNLGVFIILISILILLLSKTNLFYANPILSIIFCHIMHQNIEHVHYPVLNFFAIQK